MSGIPYGKQFISEEDILAVSQALRSDFLTQGPIIEEFENVFAKYIGCKYAIAVANGTAALHLAALSLGAKSGQKMFAPPITFAASTNCLLYCGATPEFIDIDPKTFLIDPQRIRDRLKTAKSGEFSGMIPVDFAGLPAPLDDLRSIADEFGLWILEDACHSPGGAVSGEKTWKCGDGKYADLAIFSFHPVKHIACGEGGMITTNREDLYQKLIKLRTHGITKDPKQMKENHGGWYMEMQELGYNYRLTDFQSALGISQLKRANTGMKRRHEIARRYDSAFAGTAVRTQYTPQRYFHAYHLYVIQVKNRKELYDHLKEKNIFAQVHYIPVHMHPYYQNLGWKRGDFPIAEAYYESCLSLPMYPTLTDDEQEFVIHEVLKKAQ